MQLSRYLLLPLLTAALALLASCPNSGGSGTTGDSATSAESRPELGSEARPLRMALVPSTEAEKLVETIKPISDMLSEETGYAVESEVLVSYVSAVEGMGSERFQIGWLPPFAYVLANREFGVNVALLAVRDGKPTYTGQILVGADSDIESIEDLRGKQVAFVDPSSASGHLYPRALLRDAGIDPESDLDEVIYSGSHETAVTSLYNGSVDAAACYVDAREKVERFAEDVMEETRVLAETEPIPADSIAYSEGVPPEMRERLTDAFMEIAASERGAELLYELYEIDGLTPAEDSDYDPVRRTAEVLDLDLRERIAEE